MSLTQLFRCFHVCEQCRTESTSVLSQRVGVNHVAQLFFQGVDYAAVLRYAAGHHDIISYAYAVCQSDNAGCNRVMYAVDDISLIRAGAKNFNDVVIIPSKAEYPILLDIVKKQGAATTLDQRRDFATRAFGVSSHYDTAINAWFESTK